MAKKTKTEIAADKNQPDHKKNFDFFNKIKTGNLYDENKKKFDNSETIDTGCYSLNALISGDLFKGFPQNRVIMLAGDQAVGKSYFVLRAFAKKCSDKGIFIFYVDTENAIDDEQLISFGLPEGTFKILRCSTVEDVREQISTIVAAVEEAAKKSTNANDIPKVGFILDSQGALTTRKSIAKTAEGNESKDMTKQVELKRLYAELAVRMGILNIPFILTNHLYANIGGYGDPKTIAGGSGALYTCSVILLLSIAKVTEGEKENKEVKGNIITMKAKKSRYVRRDTEIKLYLGYKTGLNRYYGLHTIALRAGLMEEFEKKHEEMGVVKPTGLGRKTLYVLKDPNVDPSKWVVCNETTLHTKEGIGTMLEPINAWIKENFMIVNNDSDFDLDPDGKDDSLLSDLADEESEEEA